MPTLKKDDGTKIKLVPKKPKWKLAKTPKKSKTC